MKDKRTAIVLDVDTFDKLWRSKELFRKIIGGKITWAGFIEQAVLFLEAQCLLPSVKAIRYNRYIYGAECPNCKTREYPLGGRGRIVWKIKCPNCSTEFIALI